MKNPKNKRKANAFTLIELLVVIAIIAILAGVTFSIVNTARASARDIVRIRNVKNTRLALDLYAEDHNNTYPQTLDQLVPAYMTVVPNDPGSKAPIYYSSDATHYHIGATVEKPANAPGDDSNCDSNNSISCFGKVLPYGAPFNGGIAGVYDLTSETPVEVTAPVCNQQTSVCGESIQAAINAATAGNTINVKASYSVANDSFPITISKALTLQGVKVGVDPRPSTGGRSGAESVIDGGNTTSNIIKIAASNVTVNGFTIRNGRADMIRQDNSYSNNIVEYNIVYDGNGDEGVQLVNCTDCFMRYNYVYDIGVGGDGLNFASASRGTITQNEVTNVIAAAGAIYTYASNNMAISNNLVYNIDKYSGSGGYGIKMGDGGTGQGVTVGTLSGNTIYDIESDAIKLMYCSGCTISGNTIYNSQSTNGALHLALGLSNITVTGNTIRNNTTNGILVPLGQDPSTFSITGNDIYGNGGNGIRNDNAALLPATGNWWGDNSGPLDSNGADGSTPATNGGSGNVAYGKINYSSWTTH
ncbi:MAG TPA: right-handed parallel beta-helix repeat-containing protein [Candidatus Paceibacterota bacterium]